jgi:hypothetical protein
MAKLPEDACPLTQNYYQLMKVVASLGKLAANSALHWGGTFIKRR